MKHWARSFKDSRATMASGTFSIGHSDLASRGTGAQIRRALLEQISANGRTEVDLAGVENLSESIADEVFGVLAAAHGWDWLKANVRLVNGQAFVVETVARAVKRRIAEGDA
jgi:hypothetical protein